LRRQLQTLRQGNNPGVTFIRSAKSLADQLAVVGSPITDDAIVSYNIGGLSSTYNSFVMTYSTITKNTFMSLEEF
jgi:hypothetical protein